MRYTLIDGFRGFFLFTMMVVHMNFAILATLPTINHHRLGWVEDAQGFVFVSGLVIGMVYGRMLLRSTAGKMRSAIWQRMWVIFRHHAFLVAVITLLAIFFAAQSPELFSRFGDEPLLFGTLALLLMAGPEFVDILPMYLVFMAFTPVALIACARGHYLGVLAVSLAVWLLAQTGLAYSFTHLVSRTTGLSGHEIWLGLYFNRLGWQILYFGGLVAGMAFVQGHLKLESFSDPRWKPVFLTAFAVMLGFAVLALLRQFVPDKLPDAFQASAARSSFGVLRLANFAADLIVVVWLLTAGIKATEPGWRRAGEALRAIFTWRPLVFLGQHSLHVYTYHVLVVYLTFTMVDIAALPRVMREILPFLGGISLFLPAFAHAAVLRRKARTRELGVNGVASTRSS